MNTEGTGFYTCKECHTTESLSNHTATVHREREQLGDQRNVGESRCNSGDGTGQMAQPLIMMMMMMMINGTWEVYACSYVNDCCHQLRLFVKGN
jgi:hypothetical protein